MTGVIFDLDGTLLDTLEDLKDAVNVALGRFGYPTRSREEVRQFVGNGAKMLMERAVPSGEDPEPALAAFREYYDANCRHKTGPYPGVLAALEQIKEVFPVAIVSNKPDSAVKALCADYFPGCYAMGEHSGCPRKPSPDMVFAAMEAISVETCVYVGDSEVDVQTAQNAGVPCLSVLWGFRTRQELERAGAKFCCDDPAQLYQRVKDILRLDDR
jgi:phosphoglycolate phosphatase